MRAWCEGTCESKTPACRPSTRREQTVKNYKRNVFTAVGALVVMAMPIAAHGAGEVKTYTSQRNTTCQGVNTYTWWDNMCDSFHDGVTASNWFFSDGQWVNSQSRRPLLDSELIANGLDTTALDDADVAMICGHGYDQGADGWETAMDQSWVGAGNNCRAERQFMSVGDRDLEQLFMSSCNSMDKEDTTVWNNGAEPTANGVHGTHGFHGVMYISSSEVSRYDDAADDALNVSISDGWLWSLYSNDWNGAAAGTNDQCPVTVHWGATFADALDRLQNSTLKTSHSDSENPSPSYYARWGIGGCNPLGDVAW